MLGEAQSKCEHIAGVPLKPELAQELHQIYLAKGVQATTAIEGNTLTEEEVMREIEGKLDLPPSKKYLGQEIQNILRACDQIREDIFSEKFYYDVEKVKNFNGQVLQDLPLREDVLPGKIREYSVVIGSYRAAPAQDCEYLLVEYCKWLNQVIKEIDQHTSKIAYSIIISIISHLYFVWIHPFGDGNGRTARLIELSILINAGIPTPACHLLSNHYNETRTEYYRQLDRASNKGGDQNSFLKYAVQGFVDQLKIQIQRIRNQQWDISWEAYIHEEFKDQNSKPEIRQRQLAIDLSRERKEVKISDLENLTPRLARQYANKKRRTVSRDVKKLVELNILRKGMKSETVIANREIILAFLPPRKPDLPF